MNRFIKKIAEKTGFKKNSKILKLSTPPEKEGNKNTPNFPVYKLNMWQQADLLHLPETKKGYKYLLVVVDLSRFAKTYPLKTTKAEDVLKGFKNIYDNSKLKPPGVIQFDGGPEFKGEIKDYFENKKTTIKYNKPHRSRQNAVVENLNNVIGHIVGLRQNRYQLKKGKKSKSWIKYIKPIVNAYNETEKDRLKEAIKESKDPKPPRCSGKSCELLTVGDLVRVPLEKPISTIDKKKFNADKFRSNDIRYEETPLPIVRLILKPGQAPMYQVKGRLNVAYSRPQLQLYKQDETDSESESDSESDSDSEEEYEIEKIISTRKHPKNKKRILYRVKFKGYSSKPEDTEEYTKSQLLHEFGGSRKEATKIFNELLKDFQSKKK